MRRAETCGHAPRRWRRRQRHLTRRRSRTASPTEATLLWMPIYGFRCPNGHCFDLARTSSEASEPATCACGQTATRSYDFQAVRPGRDTRTSLPKHDLGVEPTALPDAAIVAGRNMSVSLTDCIFEGNSASLVAKDGGSIEINHSTIVDGPMGIYGQSGGTITSDRLLMRNLERPVVNRGGRMHFRNAHITRTNTETD